jgi:rubredoxin
LRIKLPKAISVILLIIALIATFGFITGFEQDETAITDPEVVLPSKWVCSSCGYVYDPALEGGILFEGLPAEWICPNILCGSAKSSFTEVIRWICPYCSYVYDPAVAGLPFEGLPPEWICPGCSSIKSDFVKETEFGEYLSSDPWIAHLQHVLAMRSKHLAVLERVIAAHEAKDDGHSSLPGLGNALISSSKSALKAKAEIDEYLQYLSNSTVIIPEEDEEIPEEEILNSEDNGSEDIGNLDGNENSGNKDEKENSGNKDEKENKEQSNNGKAYGKSK